MGTPPRPQDLKRWSWICDWCLRWESSYGTEPLNVWHLTRTPGSVRPEGVVGLRANLPEFSQQCPQKQDIIFISCDAQGNACVLFLDGLAPISTPAPATGSFHKPPPPEISRQAVGIHVYAPRQTSVVPAPEGGSVAGW